MLLRSIHRETVIKVAMSQQHKDALKQGRTESRAIKAYLEALGRRSPGRPVTKDSLKAQLERINQKLETAETLKSVELVQKRIDVETALSSLESADDFAALESAFVKNAKSYSDRKGITYTAWREIGVPAATLRAAGVPETRRR